MTMPGNARLMGGEVEYSVLTKNVDNPDHLKTSVRHSVPYQVACNPNDIDLLVNGGRCYTDIGAHPEYGTPEVTNASDLTQQEMIGDEIMVQGVLTAVEILRENGEPKAQATLTKKNSGFNEPKGSKPASTASHENYLIDRSLQQADDSAPIFAAAFSAHMATRPIFTGAGGYITDGGEYWTSPRAYFIEKESNNTTTMGRPIIQEKDEPLVRPSEKDSWKREHSITGDANISPWAITMKFGTTNLILNALEAGAEFSQATLSHPVEALRAVGRHGTRAMVQHEETLLSPIDIQRRILAIAEEFAHTDTDKLVVEHWHLALDALSRYLHNGQSSDFMDNFDWYTRGLVIKRQEQRHGTKPFDTDFAYSNLIGNSKRGLGYRLIEVGRFDLTPCEWGIDAALTSPIAERAILRGWILDYAGRHGRLDDANWQTVIVRGRDISLPTFPTEKEGNDIEDLVVKLCRA